MVRRQAVLDGAGLVQLRQRVGACHVHAQRGVPDNSRAHRPGRPHRAAAAPDVARRIRLARPLEGAVVGVLLRLDEPRGIGRMPRPAVVLPLLVKKRHDGDILTT